MPENTNNLNMNVEEAKALGFKHLGLIPPQHPLVAEIMQAQYATADEYEEFLLVGESTYFELLEKIQGTFKSE